MSQTTRCPACRTQFKVVADQLRISQGWVRCGHCKEVFDASAALGPPMPEPLLPDISFDQLRGPVARTQASAPVKAWGVNPPPVGQDGPQFRAVPMAHESDEVDTGFAPTQPGVFESDWEPEPAFSPPPPAPPPPAHPPPSGPQPSSPPPQPSPPPQAPPMAVPTHVPAFLKPAAVAVDPGFLPSLVPKPEPAQPAGYELPAAKIDDDDEINSDWPTLFHEVSPAPTDAPLGKASSEVRGSDAPEHDLAYFIAEVAAQSALEDVSANTSRPAPIEPLAPIELPAPIESPAPEPAVPPEANAVQEPDWDLVRDEILPKKKPRKRAPAPAPIPAEESPETDWPELEALEAQERLASTEQHPSPAEPTHEPSFVRSARRDDFWSGTGARAGLSVALVVLLLALFVQFALHERARIAASWPQARHWLALACEAFHCEVGSYRDLNAVVVDGSSFNRVQADRFNLALTLRNHSAVPVQAPAIELTLTDAEDQPALRRVLLPAELAVPDPLQPGAEWSAVVPMSLAANAPRIAGYRVFAFYP